MKQVQKSLALVVIGLVLTVSVVGVDRFMQPTAAQINSGVWKDTPPPMVAIQDPFADANK